MLNIVLKPGTLSFLWNYFYFWYDMNSNTKTSSLLQFFGILCLSICCSVTVFAQRSDSVANSSRYKRIVKTPQIRGDVPSYKPAYMPGSSFTPYSSASSAKQIVKADKNLSVVRVFPNPVDDQINLTIRLERESNLTVKIMDLLGNEVVTLFNERLSAGEQTKTFNIPTRLNSGIYFLRFLSGSETIVKRISVL